ncbi:MAG: hypothetical protein M3066_04855, partial [Actinomycetota bacterium]|nr:hypothetical protein [Actinomycetota bacterium]
MSEPISSLPTDPVDRAAPPTSPPGPPISPPGPRPAADAVPGTGDQNGGGDETHTSANRRRRGSRGGRSARRPGEAESPEGTESGPGRSAAPGRADRARRPADDAPDLPERASEGRPSAEAGARALVPRPRIGDTRPAPAKPSSDAPRS